MRYGYPVELVKLQSCFLQSAIDYWNDRAHVLPRSYFRDDPAVLGMHIDLCRYYVRDYVAAILDDGGRGLITGCLDSKDLHASNTTFTEAQRHVWMRVGDFFVESQSKTWAIGEIDIAVFLPGQSVEDIEVVRFVELGVVLLD